jgi:hypothetical protein
VKFVSKQAAVFEIFEHKGEMNLKMNKNEIKYNPSK